MRRALVTGDRGFVGRHMRQALEERGWHVDGIDIARGPHSDVRRLPDCPDYSVDLVVHCAAVVGGRTMIDGQPLLLATEDLSIDAALFRWALRARPGRIVYFSSSAVYPVHEQRKGRTGLLDERWLPAASDGWDEWTFAGPDQTYGWVKLTGERLAAEANTEGIATHVFRPFSGYGADQDPAYPFPAFVGRALRHERPFRIWGDGASARDWVHIDDVVGAVLAALAADVREPVNICTGRATTFDELAGLCMDAAGYRTTVEYVVDAPQGVHRRVGDPTRLHAFYRPQITIEQGVVRAMSEALEPA